MQPSYPVEFLYPGNQNWPSVSNEDNKKTDVNLETVFQMVNELQASPKPCMVKVEPTESQLQIAQPTMGQQLPGNSFSAVSATAKATSAQLGSLTPVISDVSSLVVDAAQKSTCSENHIAGFIYPVSTTLLPRAMPILDNTAVPVVQNQSQGQACSGSVAVTQLDISQKVRSYWNKPHNMIVARVRIDHPCQLSIYPQISVCVKKHHWPFFD